MYCDGELNVLCNRIFGVVVTAAHKFNSRTVHKRSTLTNGER